MELNLHGRAYAITSLAQLQQLLLQARALSQCELWLTLDGDAGDKPALCMLRNGGNAWLMYVSPDDDASYHSVGDEEQEGECSYLLANGQCDLYPEAWCVALALCEQAMVQFYRHAGAHPAAVAWQAD